MQFKIAIIKMKAISNCIRGGDNMRKWFIDLRKQANLTQQKLADEIGVTRQLISAIENGDCEPSVTTAKSLGKLLNFPWTQFFESSV